MIKKPLWIGENPFIERLLNIFIDQCNKPNTVRFQKSINQKTAPELFDFDKVDTEFLWPLIKEKLLNEYKIIERIQYRRVPVHAEKYEKAIIYFNRSKEELVRAWLNRPVISSYTHQWHSALALYPQFGNSSLNQVIQANPHTAKQILEGFARVEQELAKLMQRNEKISLRGLSARCFWGDSKFLDKRRELLNDVFESAMDVILPRAIMLSAYIPTNLKTVIFIENFDSFLSTVKAIQSSHQKEHTAVVYSAGYRGSAELIRTLGECQFVSINSVEPHVFERFYNWWFQLNDLIIKTYFWGDLDFEGMRILKTLRNNFPQTKAWQTAYNLMLGYHENGLGHAPEMANKELQKKPELSGCNYADHELIPLLISTRRFIDQEVISQAQLEAQLSTIKRVPTS